MSIFYAIDPFERFYRGYSNGSLKVRGISYGRHFFPQPQDEAQALALAQYVGRSTGFQLPDHLTFWARLNQRFQNFGAGPFPVYDPEDFTYCDEVHAEWETFRATYIEAVRTIENSYFFENAQSNFPWDQAAYERPLTGPYYPGANPSFRYPHARLPMDMRAALEYWQYRLHWILDVYGFPIPDLWHMSKTAKVVEQVFWEGPSDPRCPAKPENILDSGAMRGWAGDLNGQCINLLKTEPVGYEDVGESLWSCPRQKWWKYVLTTDAYSEKWLGSYAYTGFLELGHKQGYQCDVRLGISRVLFSVVCDNQIPILNRQACLHIGIFQDLEDDLGTWNVELLRLPDNAHLLSPADQFDAFNDSGNVVIATFPVTDMVNNILKFPVTEPELFEYTATGRVNYGFRMEGDTLQWTGGGGNLVVPDNIPLDGTDNPACDWDDDVQWRNSDQGGAYGTCTVRGVSGLDKNEDNWVMIDNTFVFINVTAWYPELMGMDFWP